MASRIHFKYRKNILISRLYEQFSRNDSAMAPEKNFKLLKYERIIYSFEAQNSQQKRMREEINGNVLSLLYSATKKQISELKISLKWKKKNWRQMWNTV